MVNNRINKCRRSLELGIYMSFCSLSLIFLGFFHNYWMSDFISSVEQVNTPEEILKFLLTYTVVRQ